MSCSAMTVTSGRVLVIFCVLTVGLTGLVGCAPSIPAHVTPVALRTTAATSALPLQQTALAHVHTFPLYQQAEQACTAKQYSHAADLLQRLAQQKELTADEIAFVQQQRVLCLQDAGLPVPSSAVSPVHVASLHRCPASATASTATSPSDADCGPRALLLLCQRLGVKTNLAFLRQKAGTTGTGTSLEGLASAAKAVGLKAEGVQVSREALSEIDAPDAVAYVNGSHFIYVRNRQGHGETATATIHDPNKAGEETISQERLLRLCSGYLLLVKR